MKNLYVYLVLVVFFFGCSAQLRTLISLSGEQGAQRKYIDSQRNSFKSLLNDIKNKRLQPGLSSAQIVGLYGEPTVLKNTQGESVFLYRDPVDFSPVQKVYLFFDEKGILNNFEIDIKEQAGQ